MSEKHAKTARVEISSEQLRAELVEIKERVGALETVASIANRKVVEEHVRSRIKSDKVRLIMRELEEPRTREYLIKTLGFASRQALDFHLDQMREDLIHVHHDEDGVQTFVWGPLVKRLPSRVLREIIGAA